MTIDEAIQHCKEQVQEQAKRGCYSCAEEHQQLAEWLKDYKRLLDESRSEIPNTCGDAISRQEVLDEIDRRFDLAKPFKQLIQSMPSVSPQQRTGRWVKEGQGGRYKWMCSNCGTHHRALYDYCPSCGCKMEVEE